jgi:hypothetical protein
MRRLRFLVVAASVLAACGGPTQSTPTAAPTFTPATLNRPSSPVTITLISPANGELVQGTSVHVVVMVSGGTVTRVYSTNISPTKGHVHLYLNNQLVYMSYTLHQDLPVNPGVLYSMYAEWVAADHYPFSPRDVTQTIYFRVAAAS